MSAPLRCGPDRGSPKLGEPTAGRLANLIQANRTGYCRARISRQTAKSEGAATPIAGQARARRRPARLVRKASPPEHAYRVLHVTTPL